MPHSPRLLPAVGVVESIDGINSAGHPICTVYRNTASYSCKCACV